MLLEFKELLGFELFTYNPSGHPKVFQKAFLKLQGLVLERRKQCSCCASSVQFGANMDAGQNSKSNNIATPDMLLHW